MTDDELRVELLRRMEVDQEMRRAAGGPPGPERTAARARFREVDQENTAWLRSVVRARGWPLAAQVGDDGADAAWLLAQHADATPDVQREFHRLLQSAVDRGDAPLRHLAYLDDRVRVNAGLPQLYGTQFFDDGSGLRPRPIERPDELSQRRAAAGLEPFEEYAALMLRESDTE